jgi:hypothetical protein
MELEELAQRLAMLEDGAAQERAMQEQAAFIDKYGTKFSGDEGIGVAILAELGRRGIDTSAADEAVQDILDQIRAEATAILDKIKMDERTVSALMDKVATVEESVAAATGATPGADMPVGTGAPPPLEGPIPEGAGIDPNLPPEDPSMAAAAPPPMEGDLPPMEGDPSMAPPMEGDPAMMEPPMAAPPPEVPPEQVLSDKRLKSLQSRVSAARKAKPAPTWKPPANLVGAIRGSL